MRYLVVPLALVALTVTGCHSGPGTAPAALGAVSDSASPTATPSATPSPTTSATPSRVISPDLQTKTTCSVTAGKYPTMTKGVRFTAQSTVVNKGNIGAAIQLKATWIGTTKVHRAQTVSVGYGKKAKVVFNAPTNKSGAAAFKKNGAGSCDVAVQVLSVIGTPSPTK
jgi:hypothetical protein